MQTRDKRQSQQSAHCVATPTLCLLHGKQKPVYRCCVQFMGMGGNVADTAGIMRGKAGISTAAAAGTHKIFFFPVKV